MLFLLLPALCRADSAPITVTVQWQTVIAHAGALAYGLNGPAGLDPANGTSAAYNANMAYMRPGLVRFHGWGMIEDSHKSGQGWIDYAHQTWDAAKIRRDLQGIYPYHPALMVNIPGWPAWMDRDGDGFLDNDQKDAFARFCADLVKIVNKDIGRRVAYWEVTNEQDGRYYKDFHADNGNGPLKDPAKPDRLDELADIYTRCAVAMKRVDPTIKVGGPAAENPWQTDFDRRFVRAALPHLDFFSYHGYVSGSKDDPDQAVYDRADGYGGLTRTIVGLLKSESPRRPIPAFLDEYNISWTWETRDPRMANNKGAVFDALSLVSAIIHGADATAAWNDKDGVYGKTDLDDHLRPGAYAFHLFNTFLIGDVVQATTSDPKSVVAYAVRNGSRHALLLVNRSDAPQTVRLTGWGTGRETLARHEVSEAGYARTGIPAGQLDSLRLPEHSVTVLAGTRP
ncbi:MAG: hypothetical protein JO250_17095 [Armatimonadetes bacterium]|nr:hypothetical protein [Armatimonadota bacterium]